MNQQEVVDRIQAAIDEYADETSVTYVEIFGLLEFIKMIYARHYATQQTREVGSQVPEIGT